MIAVDQTLLQQVALQYRLPANLLLGQIQQESGGDPYAFRYEPAFFDRYIKGNPDAKGLDFGPLAACSYGLLQIMYETALEIGYADRPELLFTPRIGLSWGAKKMRALWDWAGGLSGDYPKALAAYNEGPGQAAGGPPFKDQAYVDNVYRFAGVAHVS